jgi:sentrin-specific protease 7
MRSTSIHCNFEIPADMTSFHWYLAIICNVKNIKRVAAGTPADDLLDFDLTTIEAHSLVPAVEPNYPPNTKDRDETGDTLQPLNPLVTMGTEPEEENLFEEERRLSLVDPEKETSQERPPAIELEESHEQLLQDDTATATTLDARSKDEASNPTPPQFKQQAKGKSKQKAAGPKRDPEKPTIVILDSLGGAHGNATKALREWLKAEGSDKRGMDAELETKAVYAKSQHIPTQSNFSDCGLYVLGYLKKFFADPNDFKNRLLKGEMSTETDWPDMDASKMRTDIRNVIIGLYDAQQEAQRKAHKAKKALKAKSTPTSPSESELETAKTVVQQAPDLVNGAERAPRANPDPEPSPAPASSRPSTPPVRRLASPFEPKAQTNPDQPHTVGKIRRETAKAAGSSSEQPTSAPSNPSPAKRIGSPEVRVSTSPKIDTSSYVRYNEATERAHTGPPQNRRVHGTNDSRYRVKFTKIVGSAARQPRENLSPPQSRIRSGSHDDPIPLDDSQDLDAPVQRRSQSARKPPPEIIELDRSQEDVFLPASYAETSPIRGPRVRRHTERQVVGRDDSIQAGALHEWREGRDTTLAMKASLAEAPLHPTDELLDALGEDPQASASAVEIPDTQPMEVDDEHDAEVPETPPAEMVMDWEADEG